MYEPVHVLSKKPTRQRRNVFIWCTKLCCLALGWHVDSDSSITVSTVYRWITDAPDWEEAERYTLFPVEVRPSTVMTYTLHQNGPGLPRESQDIIAPGDYGLYSTEIPKFTSSSIRFTHFRSWRTQCESIARCSTQRHP